MATNGRKEGRETIPVRLDAADREALAAELRRRAAAGVAADRSELVREAVRATFGEGRS